MPPRNRSSKAKPALAQRHFQSDTRTTPFGIPPRLHAVQSEGAAGYNGPITRSRANALSPGADASRSVKPPVHKLPLEVLGKIFIIALPSDQELYARLQLYTSKIQKLTNPSSFCAVCSSWRSFAFATARLWKRVFVYAPLNIRKTQAERKAAGLIQWIERSRSLRLTLYLSCDVGRLSMRQGPKLLSYQF